MNKIINCPNCGEPWSVLEVQEQECFECGYPNHDSDQEDADISAHSVHFIPHSVGGLTTLLGNKIPKQYNPLHSENRHRSEL
jgi:hypothetical protein